MIGQHEGNDENNQDGQLHDPDYKKKFFRIKSHLHIWTHQSIKLIYLFICGLFKEAVNTLDYIMSNCGMISDNEWQKMWERL